MSVGYATLYGDMCGGYSVLKDVYKTTVFELSRWRNAHVPEGALGPGQVVIPDNIITRPPSAELRENQTDQDNLPPYDVLDDILECLIENEMTFDDIVARGHDPAVVQRIEHLLYIAEYKRRQAPPGVKITRRNFGRQSDRLPACGQCPDGAGELPLCAPAGRHLHAALRRHRPGALDGRIRRRHRGGSSLAGPEVEHLVAPVAPAGSL
jgi:NAD+ synthase